MASGDFIERTQVFLKRIAPTVRLTRRDLSWGSTFEFPRTGDADYSFTVSVVEGEDPQIGASLCGTADDVHFWYWPFEIADYGSPQEQFDHFEQMAQLILTNPTRITQRNGLLSSSFLLEFYDDDRWYSSYSCGCLRLFLKTPKIDGPQHIYSSPPVAC